MNDVHLRTVDLNLLTVFDAVYEHRQVTKAADALGLTQPAVSHALNRLRALFGDALFTRARSRMEPTPRAHEIAEPISDVLRGVQRIIAPDQPFDPARSRREVRIGMLDYGMTLFATRIAAFVSAEAPGVRIDFKHTETDAALAMIENGDLDLGIGPFGPLPDAFRKNLMLKDGCVVVARRNHPVLKRKPTLERFAALGHVKFANLTAIDDQIDTQLRRNGLARRSVMTVPHYSSALFVVSRSDLVATITRGPAMLYKDFLGLVLYQAPFTLAPNEISIARHRRSFQDPLIDWFWDRILSLPV